MLPITKNHTKKTHRKIFNLALNLVLLALILIIWSCSTTEADLSEPPFTFPPFPSGPVDSIELYEEGRVPLIYTGTNAEGEPNTNLLLSGFVKYPVDGLMLDFEIEDNTYGVSIETNSTDPFEYSMLKVSDVRVVSNNVSINVVVTVKTNYAISNNIISSDLTITSDDLVDKSPNFVFAGLNRELTSEGCRVQLGVAVDSGSSTFAFNWFARFIPGGNVLSSSTNNINLALVGLDGQGGVGVIPQSNSFNDIVGNNDTPQFVSPLRVSQYYTIVNSPVRLTPTTSSPFYSSLVFTIPRNGVPMQFAASTVTSEVSGPAIDHRCGGDGGITTIR